MKSLKLLLLVSISILICSCGSKPSDSQLEKDFENSINKEYRGEVKATSFTKTNGIENENGEGTYTIIYDAEVEGLKDIPFGGWRFGDVLIGKIYKVTGKMHYKKSENGWIVTKFECERRSR